VLVDAGFSPRQIRQRLAAIGRTPENLTAILITHEHSDHISGLLGIADKFQIPVFCNRDTQESTIWALRNRLRGNKSPVDTGSEKGEHLKAKIDWRLFQTGDHFELNDLLIETFQIPHDAQDPVGYLLRTASGNIGFATDLGHTTRLVLERIRAAKVLVLESNHDVKLLQDCPRRSWSLKQRILGRHGHLSNLAAAEAAAHIMSAGLQHLYLAHLSEECNKPELAEHVMAEQLHHIGATHVQLRLAAQDVPCATLEF
jgi:phosphoribosyl 1,2-cyclic phosphodiesterase